MKVNLKSKQSRISRRILKLLLYLFFTSFLIFVTLYSLIYCCFDCVIYQFIFRIEIRWVSVNSTVTLSCTWHWVSCTWHWLNCTWHLVVPDTSCCTWHSVVCFVSYVNSEIKISENCYFYLCYLFLVIPLLILNNLCIASSCRGLLT